MFYLVVAVTLAIVGTALNLVLTFGVVRRLRVHDVLLAAAPGAAPGSDATLPVGSTVATVAAVTVDGRTVASVHPDGTRLVGFFSPGCPPCEERIPEFVRYRERSGTAALAVVVADEADSGPYVARLSGHVDVVVEAQDGPLGAAFGMTSYPALCLVDRAGVVLAGGNSFRQLPDLVPA